MTHEIRAFEHLLRDPDASPSETLAFAERLLSDGTPLPDELWHRYLELTRAPRFLQSLPDRAHRERWAETTFEAIHRSHFTLEKLIEQRVAAHGSRVFLREARQPAAWSYEQISRRIQAIAAVLYDCAPGDEPRVAIVSDNSVRSACTDLACLTYDAFVTPLDVHFDPPTLAWIFDEVRVNLAVAGNAQHAEKLEAVRALVKRPFRLVHLDPDRSDLAAGDLVLDQACSRLGQDEIASLLEGRRRRGLDEVATAMFTSGSTGRPKGVLFTSFNLLSKRFARGAALPMVGHNEVLLCYLPLFHTFGRYLELMGSLYWGGTYVFAGNPSAENLITLLQDVRPSGLISIPLRWVQIREACHKRFEGIEEESRQRAVFRGLVGDRLAWGLSAAGHLDPRVFRFFHRMGVSLCSGFGMTEATGGITMTPPGEYVDASVGIPLPGMRVRLTDIGELEIGGPYVARYLGDPEPATGEQRFLPTGDLFRVHPGGYLEIVDRVKDIYKNAKGQTVAPRKVEQHFDSVPGIKRVFLAGDGREYNTLLIVPDREDPVIKGSSGEDEVREYFRQIVATANEALARYERVVNFTILTRDFELDRGELTPKGSYRRKVIEEHFAAEIKELYRSSTVEVVHEGLCVRIPRWIFRDQGWLETDLAPDPHGIAIVHAQRRLRIERGAGAGRVRVGDLEYQVPGDVVDLGTLTRHPALWTGNAQLAAFCPVKDGWDLSLGGISPQVCLPAQKRPGLPGSPDMKNRLGDARLGLAHDLSVTALFGSGVEAQHAIEELARMLERAHDRLAGVIRRRLEALARHSELDVRCLAYRTLLLDTLVPETSSVLRSFVDSGLPFLNEQSIEAIASATLERRRLEAFRQRLYRYRTELPWPASPAVRSVFADIFKLLADFVRYHPEYYVEASQELTAWGLHDEDPELAARAIGQLRNVNAWWEANVLAPAVRGTPEDWRKKIVFHESLGSSDVGRLEQVLLHKTFLQQSIMVAFDSAGVAPEQVPDEGIWVSRLSSLHQRAMYRVSVNTLSGKHFDLLLVMVDDLDEHHVLQTVRWMVAVNAYPFGPPTVPRFGAYSHELQVISLAYIADLTSYERVRGFGGFRAPGAEFPGTSTWRKLYIRSMAVFFTTLRNSGGRIVPGPMSPANVVVLEPDFREGALVLSMADWKHFRSPRAVIAALVHNFYQQASNQYPWCRHYLNPQWLFEAWVEAVGVDAARPHLARLADELKAEPLSVLGHPLEPLLRDFLHDLEARFYVPLPLRSAIERFSEWARVNPSATARAREQFVDELMLLYGIDRLSELARYHLYRHTYFRGAGEKVTESFDRLLEELFRSPERRAHAMVELSELQAAITAPEDRAVFTRMAFPHAAPGQRVEVLAIGCEKKQVIVRSTVVDSDGTAYTVREPIEPSEVGRLYRLYVMAGFPKTISPSNCFYVALDSRDEIIGGIIFKREEAAVTHLDGIVVAAPLKGRGLNAALLEDFCRRMADQGVEVVRTFFYVRRFYTKHGFRVDSRWGGLVRFLHKRASELPAPPSMPPPA